jgi:hypothetical protein
MQLHRGVAATKQMPTYEVDAWPIPMKLEPISKIGAMLLRAGFERKPPVPTKEYLLLLRGGTGGLQPGRWQRGENKGLAFIFSERTNGWNGVPSTGRKSAQLIFEMGSNFTSSTEWERPC